MKFEVFLCHGADPESKGKIENVVKYAKHGFAKHRIFSDIDSFNADCIAWLTLLKSGKLKGFKINDSRVWRICKPAISEYITKARTA